METLVTLLLLLGWLGSIFAMAAPTPTARGTPYGHRMKDGRKTFVTFSAAPKLSVWEIEVTPIGANAGEKINTTTQHNVNVVTYAAGDLMDFTDGQFTFAYDPKMLTQLLSVIGVEQTITYTYPNGDTEAFYGFPQSYTKNALVRNGMPTGTLVIVCTNVDPINDTEEVPVITLSGGT